MRGLDVHENIDVSDTKLTLGLRVCFVSTDLTANKLFPINPRAITGPPKMRIVLEVEQEPLLGSSVQEQEPLLGRSVQEQEPLLGSSVQEQEHG